MELFDEAVIHLSDKQTVLRTGRGCNPTIGSLSPKWTQILTIDHETSVMLIREKYVEMFEGDNGTTWYHLSKKGLDYAKRMNFYETKQTSLVEALQQENAELRQEIKLLKSTLAAHDATTTWEHLPTNVEPLDFLSHQQNIIWRYLKNAEGKHVSVAFLAQKCTRKHSKDREMCVRQHIRQIRVALAKHKPECKIVTKMGLGYALVEGK